MNPDMKKLAQALEAYAGDIGHSESLMREAAVVIRSVFDPENQPSQYGTVLTATTA